MDHMKRLDHLAQTRQLGVVCWGGNRYNNYPQTWHIEVNVTKGSDKFELKGFGETLDEAAQEVLTKYDAIVMGVPMFTPAALLEAPAQPDEGILF